MTDFLILITIVLLITMTVLGLLLSYYFLMQTDYFFSLVFPKKRPEANLFFSKKKEDGDRLILYYGARSFVACLIAMSAIWVWRSFNSN